MKTISGEAEHTFSDKGSKFIGMLFPVNDEFEAQAALDRCRKLYPDATHHCYAWRIGPEVLEEFAQDDGEPAGTAGLPILNSLKSSELVNVLCVVIRYYGGTKLGKTGLIQAYRQSAEGCIAAAPVANLHAITNMRVSFPYQEQKTIDQLIHTYQLRIEESLYHEQATLLISCDRKLSKTVYNHIAQLSWKGISVSITEERFGIISS